MLMRLYEQTATWRVFIDGKGEEKNGKSEGTSEVYVGGE
tara:strand:+ start:1810 stop:1926 length:117 start_codon:yes stop_codon:yes gene_type:complete